MAVPSGINFVWLGTHASVAGLTGWSRNTTLDDKYVLGAASGADGGGTGGSATHTHTATNHTHTGPSHAHTLSGSTVTATQNADFGSTNFNFAHNHGNSQSASHSIVTSSSAVVFVGASNDPQYVKVIFIESAGTNDIPDDAVGYYDQASDPADWAEVTALKDHHFKGAAASANADTSSAGSATHTHTEDTPYHTHTSDHTHGASTSAKSSKFGSGANSTFGTGGARPSHTHAISSVSGGGGAGTLTSASAATLQASNGEAPFTTLKALQNQSGAEAAAPLDIIGLWFGTRASIPADWAEVTAGRDKFIKAKADGTAIGDTGGADQHGHTSNWHNHTIGTNPHSHTTVVAGFASSVLRVVWAFPAFQVDHSAHTHTWTVSSTSVSFWGVQITVASNSSKSNYPEYVTAILIKNTVEPPSGEAERGVHTMAIGMGMSRL